MRSIWDRKLETKRMIFATGGITIIRNKARRYNPTQASRNRVNMILKECEDAGANHYVVPDNLKLS